jgi:hypothetical protein
MTVRSIAAGDGPSVRRLWDELGGWYRNTSPAGDADVDRAIGRLIRHPISARRRKLPAEAGWVAESGGKVVGWLYARTDSDQNYIVPLVPPEETSGALEALLTAARGWFTEVQAAQFLVDVPVSRPDLRAAAQSRGRVLWHRAVLDRDLSPYPSASAVPATVREFRRGDLSNVQALFEARHPEKPPTQIPVAFLELRGGLFRDPAWDLQRSILLAGPREQLLGVAGGTHRPKTPIGFLGPWVLAQAASPPVAVELLGGVVSWLSSVGAQRVRTTIPMPPSDDARTLLCQGFTVMAESDLFEVKS